MGKKLITNRIDHLFFYLTASTIWLIQLISWVIHPFYFFVSVFILYYVLHGVFREKPYEIIVSVAAVVTVLLYCIVDYAVNKKRNTFKKVS